MGFVFQDFSLIPSLSAMENITYPLIPRGVPRAERRRRTAELLSRFGMGDKLAARAAELSGGERQRVAVARALAGRPEVVLADEPTSNLDPETGRTLLAIFRELHAEGKTMILASHDPAVFGGTDRVFELEGGKIENGADGLTRPQSARRWVPSFAAPPDPDGPLCPEDGPTLFASESGPRKHGTRCG